MQNNYEDLEKAKRLLDEGVISQEEYEREKARLLSQSTNTGPSQNNDGKPWGMEENTFCMLMHLSQFLGWLLPVLGFVVPIVMWLTQKDSSVKIDDHGKNIANYFISYLIWIVISIALSVVFIGIFMLLAIMVLSVVFTIMATVKANNGECWAYPLSIKFLKTSNA